jgi:hypothetical protein
VTAPLLFLHPHNHAFPKVLAVGSIAALNLLPQPKLGRFAGEVSREELEAARVVLLDLHWFLPLGVLDAMLAGIRAVNPELRIVVGGITAAFYAELIVERHDVDYLVSGDVEPWLPLLVEHLLAGEQPPPLPNVWARDRRPASGGRLTQAQFDALDWITIDWFPSYRQQVHQIHRLHPRGLDPHPYKNEYYPHLVLTRGCWRQCHHCAGSHQERVFGPGVLQRSPDRLISDLERIAADPELAFATLVFADQRHLQRYAAALEGQSFALDAFLFYCGSAAPETLDRIRSGFAGDVDFSIVQPADLRGAELGPEADAEFQASIAHLRGLARTRAIVFHVDRDPPDWLPRAGADASLRVESGRDWLITRPNLVELGADYDAARQLDDVLAAAQRAMSGFLLPLLVPTLRMVPVVTAAVDVLPDPLDPLESRLVEIAIEEIRTTRAYGFAGLELGFCLRNLEAGTGAAWLPPGEAVPGECRWFAGAFGYDWEGSVEVGGDARRGLGICPTVIAGSGERVDLSGWHRARIPTVELDAGPRRLVQVRGGTSGERVRIEIGDRGRVKVHVLEPCRPEDAAPAWCRWLLAYLKSPTAARELSGFELARARAGEHALVLWFEGAEAAEIEISRRSDDPRATSTALFSFTYRGGPGSLAPSVLGRLVRLIRRAELRAVRARRS